MFPSLTHCLLDLDPISISNIEKNHQYTYN